MLIDTRSQSVPEWPDEPHRSAKRITTTIKYAHFHFFFSSITDTAEPLVTSFFSTFLSDTHSLLPDSGMESLNRITEERYSVGFRGFLLSTEPRALIQSRPLLEPRSAEYRCWNRCSLASGGRNQREGSRKEVEFEWCLCCVSNEKFREVRPLQLQLLNS